MKNLLLFSLIISYLPLVAQHVPLQLLSNDIPYHDVASALTQDPSQSHYVLFPEDQWRFATITEQMKAKVLNDSLIKWTIIDHIDESKASVYAFKNTFYVNNDLSEQWTLHVPASDAPYSIHTNGQAIPLNFIYTLDNNLDITDILHHGSNDITITVDPSSDRSNLPNLLKGLYVIRHKEVYYGNLTAMGNLKTNYNSMDLTSKILIKKRTFITAAFPYDSIDYTIIMHFKEKEPKRVTFHSYVNQPRDNIFSFTTWPTSHPQRWTAETPNMHMLTDSLYSNHRDISEVLSQQIGHRDVDLNTKVPFGKRPNPKGLWTINDKKLRLKALYYNPGNLADTNQLTSEIIHLKQNHYNALYIKAGETADRVLDICDRIGMYVLVDITMTDYLNSKYSAGVDDILQHFYFTYIKHPSFTAWVYRNTDNTYARYKKAYNTYLNKYKAPPIVLLSDNPDYVKVHLDKKVVWGLELTDTTDVEKLSGSFLSYPFVIFNNSNQLETLEKTHLIEKLVQGRSGNIQGIVMNKQRLEDQEKNNLIDALKNQLSCIEMDWIKNTTFSIYLQNNFTFTNLSTFDFSVELWCQTEKVATETLDSINIAAGQNDLQAFDLHYSMTPEIPYQLKLICRLKKDTNWAPKGFIMAEKHLFIHKDEKGHIYPIAHQKD